MPKISAVNDSCPQKNRTESEGYVGVQTFIGITENNLPEVHFRKDDLLEHILSPANLNKAYKQVILNGGSGGVDKMETEELLPFLKLHKDELVTSLMDGDSMLRLTRSMSTMPIVSSVLNTALPLRLYAKEEPQKMKSSVKYSEVN